MVRARGYEARGALLSSWRGSMGSEIHKRTSPRGEAGCTSGAARSVVPTEDESEPVRQSDFY